MTPVIDLCEKVHTVDCTNVCGHPERTIRTTQVHAKEQLSTSFDSSEIELKASIQRRLYSTSKVLPMTERLPFVVLLNAFKKS